jgi:hypothetical protein
MITSHILVSVGKLCDEGCQALFLEKSVIITGDNKILMTGHRDKTTKLWFIPLSQPTTPHHIGAMTAETSTQADLH